MKTLTALLLATTFLTPTLARAQERVPERAPAAPFAPGQRTRAEIGKDLSAAHDAIDALIPSEAVFHDPAKRAAIADKAIPVFKRIDALMTELTAPSMATLPPERVQLSAALRQLRNQPELIALGDADTIASVEKRAQSADASEALLAKAISLLSQYLSAPDAAAQTKAATSLAALQASAPKEQSLDFAAATLVRSWPLSDDVRESVTKAFKDSPGQMTKGALGEVAAANAQKVYENKPMVLAGETVNGKQFSTASLKGKVILVDFWATWCGPCKAELPRVKKLYAQYKDQGLEIVGVSCDNKADALMSYLAANPDMPWTQLFDVNKPGWHPLAKQYDITGIPVMFLIDRNGVCRSVEARESMEALIPKLLAEQPGM